MSRARTALRTLREAVSSDPALRYEARHYAAAEIALRLGGFRVYNKGLLWVDDPEFLDAWNQFPEATPSIKDRKYVVWSMARSTANLPGRTAECGVYDGGSSWLICMAGERGPRWRHHMFDSFEGLSEPGAEDTPESERTFRWQQHDLRVALERVRTNMGRFADVVDLHPGWIPDAFDEVAAVDEFSFVHVDVDLYQPTRDSLEFFYPRLVPGAVLLCDDYGFASCPGATRAFDEFIADKPERSVVHLTSGQGYIVKR